MEPTTIIRKPLITEKTTFAAGVTNRYAFQVDPRADKGQIKRAVESIYGVRVLAVATQNRVGKVRRTKYGYVKSSPTKRALVKIHPDDRIELF
jgi:large subunit ribosomal protein L23